MYYVLAKRKAEVARLTEEKQLLDSDLKFYEQDAADIEGLKEWDQYAIPWLDELYDLTARFPYEKGFRINHIVIDQVSAKNKVNAANAGNAKDGKNAKNGKDGKDAKLSKDTIVARVRITGVSPSTQKDYLVQQMQATMRADSHLRPTIEIFPRGVTHEFVIRVDVLKQPASKYETVLQLPSELARAGPAGGKGKGRFPGGQQ